MGDLGIPGPGLFSVGAVNVTEANSNSAVYADFAARNNSAEKCQILFWITRSLTGMGYGRF
jgi:hypothetical protein